MAGKIAALFRLAGAGFVLAREGAFATVDADFLPALILLYLASLILMLPAFFILVVGLSDTRKAIALTPNKDADAPKQTDSNI